MNAVRDAVATYCKKYSIAPAFPISDVYDLQADWAIKD